MEWTQHQILLFFLILVRMTALFMSAPVFSLMGIPVMFKIGLGGLTALLIYPMVDATAPELPLDWLLILVLMFQEIVTGVLIGFAISLLFAGIQLAGEYIGLDMGFAIAQEVDPTFRQPVSVIARFENNLAMLLFLLLEGHHYLIEAVVYSYRSIPVGGWHFPEPVLQRLLRLSADVFIVGMKIAAPAVVALFLTSVAMGIIARAVPQMNIFFVGIPIRVLVGFASLIFGMPLFVYVFSKLLTVFERNVSLILRAI